MNALELMNEAARHVMREFKGHITLAFGESDEYRYVILILIPAFLLTATLGFIIVDKGTSTSRL